MKENKENRTLPKRFEDKAEAEGLIPYTLPAGPTISGQVTVPLAELDKMRQDHAALLHIAEELRSRQKQVIVKVIKKELGVKEHITGYSRYGEPIKAFMTDENYVAISTDYKNLTEVQQAIYQEIFSKFEDEIASYKSTIKNHEERIKQHQEEKDKAVADAVKKEAEAYEKLRTKLDDYKGLHGQLDNVRSLNKQLEAAKDRVDKQDLKIKALTHELNALKIVNEQILSGRGWWQRFWGK